MQQFPIAHLPQIITITHQLMQEELSESHSAHYLAFDQPELLFPPIHTPYVVPQSTPSDVPPITIKADNPYELYKDYPSPMRESLIDCYFKKKLFAGIQFLFGLGPLQDQQPEFLASIDPNAFNSHDSYNHLMNLFHVNEDPKEEADTQHLAELTGKLSQIQHKAFKEINAKDATGHAFAERFDNFTSLKEESGFTQYLVSSLDDFLAESKKRACPGIGLISMTFEFWMKMFKEFMRQVWKYNKNYSLNLFKKQKSSEGLSTCGRSTTSSSQNADKDKRRQWARSEIELLEKIINSNAVFSQARLQELSAELNRSPSSISSKVAKLIKFKKADEYGGEGSIKESSIEGKLKHILSSNAEGLTREDIIEKMSRQFEMGVDESWKNSVGSILSSCKDIIKMKAPFSLVNAQAYSNYTFANNIKDKVIQATLHLPNCQGTSSEISQKYSELFHEGDCRMMVAKALTRYGDVFDRANSKVKYRLSGGNGEFKIDDVIG